MDFSAEKITDAKRLVRGEQLLYARTLLLSRSPSRLLSPSVMMLAGGAPHEEVGSIRSLWPHAHIVAIDSDSSCTALALSAGANTALCVDLKDLLGKGTPASREPPPEVGRKFEIIDLDFCGPVSSDMRDIIKRCCLTILDRSRGILILTFSYGRDVAEFFLAQARDGHISYPPSEKAEHLMSRGCPETVAGRILYLAEKMGSMTLRSLCLYQGNRMPMCSTLWEAFQLNNPRGWADSGVSVTKATNDDLVEPLMMPDPSLLYAVPAERILAMRRSAAARRAVVTRKTKAAPQFESGPPLVHGWLEGEEDEDDVRDGLRAVYCGAKVRRDSGEWSGISSTLLRFVTCGRCRDVWTSCSEASGRKVKTRLDLSDASIARAFDSQLDLVAPAGPSSRDEEKTDRATLGDRDADAVRRERSADFQEDKAPTPGR